MHKFFVSSDGTDTVKDPTPLEGATLRRRGYSVHDTVQAATAAAKKRRDAVKAAKGKAAAADTGTDAGDASAGDVSPDQV